nr:integrase, catalytic region, zinc finger, CCHC-type, peptidase aspartic, catalytic [Tanacetum cinerariifolium]
MTGDHSRLRNFMKKFIETIRFGNDHFGAIMGYGDYMISDSVISKVYYIEGLGHNLFSVRKFYDSDLEVTFRKHSCYVKDVNGVDLIKGKRGRPEPSLLTPGQISSRLVPDPVPVAFCVPSTNKDLEILFHPMFDEYFKPSDAPSTSYSPSSSVVQPPISHQSVAAGPTIKVNPLAQADNDPFVNVFALGT